MSVPLPIGTWDTYDWYRAAGTARERGREVLPRQDCRPGQSFVAHPAYDAYWQARAVQRGLKAPAVPTLTVGGWWDQEDRYGPLATYRALERGDSGAPELSRDGALEPRRLAPRRAAADGGGGSGHVGGLPARRRGALVRLLAQGQGQAARSRKPTSTTPAPSSGARSTPGRPRTARAAKPLPPRRRPALVRSARARASAPYDQYVSDPAHPVPVPAAAGRADLRPARLALAGMGDGGPAIRGRPARRGELGVGAADRGPDHRRRRDRAARGLHHRAATPTGS